MILIRGKEKVSSSRSRSSWKKIKKWDNNKSLSTNPVKVCKSLCSSVAKKKN